MMCATTERQELINAADWTGKEQPRGSEEEELAGIQTVLDSLESTEITAVQTLDTSIPIRHLRAQKGNAALAVQSIRDTLAFRHEFFGKDTDVDNPKRREEITPDVKTGRLYVRGYDSDGRAMVLIKALPVHYQNDASTEHYLLWTVEKAIRCTKRRSGLEKFVVAFDYANYSSRYESTFGIVKRFVTNLQLHYPERVHKVFIVDAPVAFRAFYAIVKPFVDPDTVAKIVFCGSADMRPVTERMVEDPDELEAFMGGTKSVRDFDAEEYLTLPFDKAFDER